MPHPSGIDPDKPFTRTDKQQGAGQGTSTRRRREPNKAVQSASITEASGATLGEDGRAHPLETDPEGNLKVRVRDITSLLEEMISLQKATLFAIAESNDDLGLDFDDLVEMFC